jgi:predicted ATP-grasp superfamily ATP-dependent carboligase
MNQTRKAKQQRWNHKALVLGRIGIIRSLGREEIPVAVARESLFTFERASRYCKEYIVLPDNIEHSQEKAVEILEKYGSRQDNKPVIFLNGESDVLLISKYRQRLSKYYLIMLAQHNLINNLLDKGKFGVFAEEYDLPVPKTIIPNSKNECFEAAEKIGYPCIVKPIRQRLWHDPQITHLIGFHKALLINSHDKLERLIEILPPIMGGEMIQEYIPGDDQLHFDFHTYIDKAGNPLGYIVGHKIRTHPIHFGMGSYTHFVEEPKVAETCLEVLRKIGYTGAANINIKRHKATGEDYILEINPRFSIWTIIDSVCGVNLPLLQYLEALEQDLPDVKPNGKPHRWLRFGADFRAMLEYRKIGELTIWEWLKSYFSIEGKIEFHIFSWDDPLPLIACWLISIKDGLNRIFSFLRRRLA